MVHYTSDRVEVVTSGERLQADIALVTVPLGVLKHNKLRFDPPLEPAKRQAIDRIGYGGEGVLGKLIMRFPARFWPTERQWMISLPPDPAQRGVFTSWLNLEGVVGAPLLLAFANGHAAANFDRSASNEEVCAAAMTVLDRMFPGRAIPPEKYIFTRWLSDPWALGSYSYPAVGSPLRDRDLYAAPVANRLYFAGEGTQKVDFGTVHAALRSGEQAAEQILMHHVGRHAFQFHAPWARG